MQICYNKLKKKLSKITFKINISISDFCSFVRRIYVEHFRVRPWYESIECVQQSRETSHSIVIGSEVILKSVQRGGKKTIFSLLLRIFKMAYKHIPLTH